MVIDTSAGLPDGATVVLAVALAFVFGYALTMRGVLKAGLTMRQALRVALAVAFVVTVPANRALMGRGMGHAVSTRCTDRARTCHDPGPPAGGPRSRTSAPFVGAGELSG